MRREQIKNQSSLLRVNTCYFSVVHFFISLYSPPSKRRSLVTDGDGTSLFFFDPLSAKDLGLHPLAELSRPGQTGTARRRVHPGRPPHFRQRDPNTEDVPLSNKLSKARKGSYRSNNKNVVINKGFKDWQDSIVLNYTHGL